MAQFASDSFTGTTGDTLQVYSANWSRHPSYSNNVLIANNRCQLDPVGAASSAYCHSATPATADYSVSIDIYVASYTATNNLVGVVGRASTSVNTFYHARHSIGAGWQMYRFVSGAATQLGSAVAATLTPGNTYNLKLDMSGSAIKLYVDSVATIEATDTGITSAGKAGIRAFNNAYGTAINAEQLHIDNFSADEAGGGGGGAAIPVFVNHYRNQGIM
ncbi:hypothetical protein [Nitrosovibrio sp. Nv4]|uniref:hypothetical protein n=1 Tax=Nitrosovibrio sp. Nv4 TaxID=1945880 RepID=UPI000BCF7C53|nr:hypothetical protein [Nitrosovibrio sp. Nv4]SOD42354.1 hypothetical protein SAMN06298226_2693 [Nitrosovibrio sp. Nv4]